MTTSIATRTQLVVVAVVAASLVGLGAVAAASALSIPDQPAVPIGLDPVVVQSTPVPDASPSPAPTPSASPSTPGTESVEAPPPVVLDHDDRDDRGDDSSD